MSISAEIAKLMKRYHFSENSPIKSVDDSNFFYCDKDKKSAYIGAVFLTNPIIGISQADYKQLVNVLSMPLPPETIIQFSNISTNHIDDRVLKYQERINGIIDNNPNITPETQEVLRSTVNARIEGILEAKVTPPIPRIGVTVRHSRLLVSIKVPVDLKLTPVEYQTAVDHIIKISDGLRNGPFKGLQQLDVREYLAQKRSILYSTEDLDYNYDSREFVGQQAYTPTTVITAEQADSFKINDVYYKMLSVKTLPSTNTIALMNEIIGGSDGVLSQMLTPYLINATFVTQDVQKKNQTIEALYMQAEDQCTPFALKFAPALRTRRDGYKNLFHATKESQIPCELTFNVFMFHSDQRTLNRCVSAMEMHYNKFHLVMKPDSDIVLPMFWNALPLNPSPVSLDNSARKRTLTFNQGSSFIPAFADDTGRWDNFSQLYYTRRNSLYGFDPTTGLNQNGMLLGGSGSGKSFLMSMFMLQEYEAGAMIRVIDEGRSYKKLCEIVGGQFIEFNKDSNVCINPFTHITDIDENLDSLASEFLLMAYPKGEFEDVDKALMSEAIKSCFENSNTKTQVDNIIIYLRNQDNNKAQQIARLLYNYSSKGPYGKWFNGENNLNLDNAFVVLELEDLKQHGDLKTVVMMMLLHRIQHDMMKNKKYPRKFVFFEEVSSYLKQAKVAEVIADFYARLRKYNAGVWLITQSMSSIKNTPAVEDMINNSYTKIYLMHSNKQEITELARKGYIPDNEHAIESIKGLETKIGEYSEAYILRENYGAVVRLIVPRFFQVLFGSKGLERDLIHDCQAAQIPVAEAVNEFIRFENRGASTEELVDYFKTWQHTSKLASEWLIPYKKYKHEFDTMLNSTNKDYPRIIEHFDQWVSDHGSDTYLKRNQGFGLDGFDM